jgi:hypothetical protein
VNGFLIGVSVCSPSITPRVPAQKGWYATELIS